jgi:hypothetical protein
MEPSITVRMHGMVDTYLGQAYIHWHRQESPTAGAKLTMTRGAAQLCVEQSTSPSPLSIYNKQIVNASVCFSFP